VTQVVAPARVARGTRDSLLQNQLPPAGDPQPVPFAIVFKDNLPPLAKQLVTPDDPFGRFGRPGLVRRGLINLHHSPFVGNT